MLRENPTCYLYYPWYMQICSTGVYFFCFLPVQVNTPAGLKGQEVTRSLLLPSFLPSSLPPPPSITPPHCGPTSWPSLSRCDACRSVDGGSGCSISSGGSVRHRLSSWKTGRRCISRTRRPVSFFSCWIVWPPKRQKLGVVDLESRDKKKVLLLRLSRLL